VLKSDLQTLRSQIELYKMQHLDMSPGVRAGQPFSGELLVRQLTHATSAAGEVEPSRRSTEKCPYGPYLKSFPRNPFVKGPQAVTVTGGAGPASGDGKTGWYFDVSKGFLYANDPEHKDW